MEKRAGAKGVVVTPGQPSPVTVVLRLFCEGWKARYGVPYSPKPAECKLLKEALARTPAEVLRHMARAVENYMSDEDPFVAQKMRHCLAQFCNGPASFAKYLTETPIYSEKEARGRAAGEMWLRMHEERDNASK